MTFIFNFPFFIPVCTGELTKDKGARAAQAAQQPHDEMKFRRDKPPGLVGPGPAIGLILTGVLHIW